MEKLIKALGLIIILAVIVGAVSLAVNYGEKKSAVVACNKLEAQSNEGFANFFVTQWQKDMCDTYGFTFAGSRNAPVHVDTMRNGGDGYLLQGVWYTNGLGKWKLETSESGFTE